MVASDRGAVGEGIEPGENGFIIDVSNGRGLTEVLIKLDTNVARYQAPPPLKRASMFTAAEHGAEIAELYRRLTVGRRHTVDPV